MTLLVVGDGRGNGLPPGVEHLRVLRRRVHGIGWITPEPHRHWTQGHHAKQHAREQVVSMMTSMLTVLLAWSGFKEVDVTEEELAEIIDNLRVLGSDVTEVEAKRSKSELPRSVRETLSSFSNSTGGTLILGLDEASRFAAVGVDDPACVAERLANMCASEMEPPLRPLIVIHDFEGIKLVVAEVPEVERTLKPCFYKGAGITQGSYVRLHDGDHKLSSYEVQAMLSSRGQPRDDEQATPAGVSELDPVTTEQFVNRLRVTRPYAFRDLDSADVLRRAKVTTADQGGVEFLTVAGLLALGAYPQQHYPQLMLTFVHFMTVDGSEASDGSRFTDNVAVEGPIPTMVREALAVVRRNMARRSVISGPGRQDVPEYPETALREAIVNALVHRDLSPASSGTQVQIEMYPDRLTIRNPGGLFGPVTVSALGEEGVSSSRNATLLKLLEDVFIPGESRTICENRGSGIRAMLAALRSARMSPPEFQDRIASFSVTFPNHSLLSDEIVAWIGSLGEVGLSDSQCIGLAMLREGHVLDNMSFRTATGVDSRVATTELQDLVAREIVEQTGNRRWARYQLSARASSPTEEGVRRSSQRRPAPADRRNEILMALADNVKSRSEIADITGLSNQTVRRWLTILRGEGRVEIAEGRSPQSRNARYRSILRSSDDPQQGAFDLD